MKKIILLLLVLSSIFVVGCSNITERTFCEDIGYDGFVYAHPEIFRNSDFYCVDYQIDQTFTQNDLDLYRITQKMDQEKIHYNCGELK